MKHGGGSVMFWVASGTGCLESVQGTMKSQDYQGILKQDLLPSFRKFCLSCKSWVLQQNNDQKLKALWEQNIGLFWCGTLCVLIWILSNIYGKSWNLQSGEGNHQTWDSWSSLLRKSGAKLPVNRCRCLIESCSKCLIAVIASKGCATKY